MKKKGFISRLVDLFDKKLEKFAMFLRPYKELLEIKQQTIETFIKPLDNDF